MTVTAPGWYGLLRQLHESELSIVHEAIDTRTGEHVALKLLGYDTARMRGPFEELAPVVAALSHPNLVPVREWVDLCVAMPLLEGVSLERLIEGDDWLSWPRARAVALQMLDALGAVHAIGHVHGDVRPRNAILGPGDATYLLDFGIQEVFERASQGETRTGFTRWEPLRYLSLERLKTPVAAVRDDLFCVGLCLWEMLMCQPARPHGLYGALLSHIFYNPLPPLPMSHLSAPQIALLERAFKHHFESAAEFAQALRDAP